MIDALSRERLRKQAKAAWEDAKRLHREAGDLITDSQQLLRMTEDRRARFRDANWRDRRALTRNVEMLADRAIRMDANNGAEHLTAKGTGLVASINLPTLVRLETLVGTRLGYVVGAQDAGTALGLAIATQPDIAVVDSRLDVASGADLALTFPFFAPQTKALLLTDDPELTAKAALVGIDVLPRWFAEPALLSWVSENLAAAGL